MLTLSLVAAVATTGSAAAADAAPVISEIPTDGSPVDMDLIYEASGNQHYVYWELHTIGEVVIEGWDPRSSVTCRGTAGLCLIESETEFLGGRDARVSGSGRAGPPHAAASKVATTRKPPADREMIGIMLRIVPGGEELD